jgi:hypothetical protein
LFSGFDPLGLMVEINWENPETSPRRMPGQCRPVHPSGPSWRRQRIPSAIYRDRLALVCEQKRFARFLFPDHRQAVTAG